MVLSVVLWTNQIGLDHSLVNRSVKQMLTNLAALGPSPGVAFTVEPFSRWRVLANLTVDHADGENKDRQSRDETRRHFRSSCR